MEFTNNRISEYLVKILGVNWGLRPKLEVIPTIDSFPPVNVVKNFNKTTTATGTLYTTPEKGSFWLRWVHLNFTANVTCDGVVTNFSVFIDGLNFNMLRLYHEPLTSQSENLYIVFPGQGILIDKNTAIAAGSTFTAGACTTGCTIGGTLIEENY
jgi:hypothetical protein